MSRNLFHSDSGLMIVMGQITDCIFLSIFWFLCCVPVVTIGPATAALYDATFRAFRQGSKHSWSRFFHSFRQNLKAGVLPGLIVPGLGIGLGWSMIRIWNAAVAGSISWMIFSGAALIGVLVLGTLSLVLPVLSRFENSFLGLIKNSVLLALGNLPRTIALGVVNGVAIYLCARFIFGLFFLPSLAALVGSLFIEPMLKPFMEENPTEQEVS